MTLNEFLDNPIGKGDASVNTAVIKSALDVKYRSYTDASTGKKKIINLKIYRQPMKDIYWIVMTIPSETERTNSYDVVYKFINPKPMNRTSLSISKFDIQIFANSPSFAYTYSYVYNKHGLLIPELSSKLGRKFTSTAPDTRNRNQIILYDKYVYFGARYILDSKVLNRMVADAKSSPYDEKYLQSHIRTLNNIMDDYRIAEEKLKGKKKATNNHKAKDTGKIKGKSITPINHVNGGVKKDDKVVAKAAARKSTVQKKRGTIPKR